jgi:hypothetical protein
MACRSSFQSRTAVGAGSWHLSWLKMGPEGNDLRSAIGQKWEGPKEVLLSKAGVQRDQRNERFNPEGSVVRDALLGLGCLPPCNRMFWFVFL